MTGRDLALVALPGVALLAFAVAGVRSPDEGKRKLGSALLLFGGLASSGVALLLVAVTFRSVVSRVVMGAGGSRDITRGLSGVAGGMTFGLVIAALFLGAGLIFSNTLAPRTRTQDARWLTAGISLLAVSAIMVTVLAEGFAAAMEQGDGLGRAGRFFTESYAAIVLPWWATAAGLGLIALAVWRVLARGGEGGGTAAAHLRRRLAVGALVMVALVVHSHRTAHRLDAFASSARGRNLW